MFWTVWKIWTDLRFPLVPWTFCLMNSPPRSHLALSLAAASLNALSVSSDLPECLLYFSFSFTTSSTLVPYFLTKSRALFHRNNSMFISIALYKMIRTPQGSSSGFRPPADPKGPPFDTFSEIHFWRTDPKSFLKAPLAPIYTNFEGERTPKKTQFFGQNFSKSAQKRLFWLFFQKFAPPPSRKS